MGLGLPDVSDHFLVFFLFDFADLDVVKDGGGIVVSVGGFEGELGIEVLLDDVKESIIGGLDFEDGVGSFADEFVVESEDLVKRGVVKFVIMGLSAGL